MKTTTIKIYSKHLEWWNKCCKAKGKNSQDTFEEFRESVKMRKQNVFYESLPMPSEFVKPLSGIKILRNENKFKDMRDFCVYFIESINGWIKIGVAKKINNRLKELQIASPVELKLLATLNGASFYEEMLIHDFFSDHLIRGEWFRSSPAMIGFINNVKMNLVVIKHRKIIVNGVVVFTNNKTLSGIKIQK